MAASPVPHLPPGFSDAQRLAGGSSELWKARFEGRDCVLRLAEPDSEDGRDQAWSELAGLAALAPHPGLAQLLGHGEFEGRRWIAREWVRGLTLAELPAESPAPAAVGRWMVQLCEALAVLHEAGWVHGDLKPENVILRSGASDQPVLTDFGMTQRLGERRKDVGGSLFALAPEVLLGAEVDARSDLYAIGVMMIALLGAATRVSAEEFYARFPRQAGFFEAAEIDPSSLPEWSRGIVERCVARAPNERPQSAFEVALELARILELPLPRERMVARLRLGPRSGRESWLRTIAHELAQEGAAWNSRDHELARAPAAESISLVVDSSEPLDQLARELRLDVALLGAKTVEARFEPRRLASAEALEQWIEETLPDSGGLVFLLDDSVDSATKAPWRDEVWRQLERGLEGARALKLIRIARRGEGALPLASLRARAVPNFRLEDLRDFLSKNLENGAAVERVEAFAERLLREGCGDWSRVNRVLDAALERGVLTPGDRALFLHASNSEDAWLETEVHVDLEALTPEARRFLAAFKVAERGAGASKLSLPERSAREAELEHAGLVVRRGRRLELTDAGHFHALQLGPGFGEEDRREIYAAEAQARTERGEDLGEVLLLRLRAAESEAATALCQHAERTRERGAPVRALDWLQRALDVAELRAADRCLLLGEWSLVQAELGQLDKALEGCRQLEEQGAGRAAARTRARVATSRREFDQAQREWELAVSLPGATHLEREEALFGKVRLLAEQGRTADLKGLVDELRAGVHGALDGRRLLNARSLLATAQLRESGSASAVEELRHLQDEARRLHDPALEAGISLNLGTALRRRGGGPEIEEAIQLFERSCALYEKDGHLPGLAQARAALGGTLREEGQVALAIEALSSSLHLRERLGNRRGAASVRGMLGLAFADRGELGAATVELEAAATELRDVHGLNQAAQLFEARLELEGARLGRREQLHFDPLEFEPSSADPRRALALARAAALRGRRDESVAAARAAMEAAEKRGWRRASEEAQFLLREFESSEGAPLKLPDAQLFAAIREDHGAEETLLRIARELGRKGRRDRAARAWLALAHRSEDAERSAHARSAAERELRACARGLSEAEADRLKRSLLSLPDPRPADLERQVAGSPGRRESELQALLDIQARLVDQEDLPSLLGKIVECALEIAGGERGFLLLEEEGELVFDTALDSRRGEDIAAPEVEVSRSVVRRALEVGAPLRLSNATADPLLGAAPSVTALELRSILCTPFDVQHGLRGVIYLDHRLRTGAFGDRAEELLLHLAGQAALAIRQVRRVAEIRRLNEKLSRRVIDAEADLQSARRALEDAGLTKSHKSGLVGRSAGMQAVRALLERAAPSRLPVLIQGESGTGKELAARALHEQSGSRRAAVFVSESCAALPESLIESELFGYRRGAFTGAEEDRPGIFERADGGTLFLDEIGELPLDLQSKLLRVLETGRVRRLGDAEELRVDFRLIAATNRDLEEEVAHGRFRADLLYRLDALRVEMPPLRTRLEDIPLLVEHFVRRESEHGERAAVRRVSDSVMAALCRRSWPGNVRELANEVARLCVLSEGDLVDAELVRTPAPQAAGSDGGIEPLESLERRAILAAIEATGDDKRQAAAALGISRAKIYQKLKAWRSRGLID